MGEPRREFDYTHPELVEVMSRCATDPCRSLAHALIAEQAALAEAKAEIARLRDMLERHDPLGHNVTNGQHFNMVRRAEAAEGRVKVLEWALRPLAEVIEGMPLKTEDVNLARALLAKR